MDLSKVAAKALHNLIINQPGGSSKEEIIWHHDWLKKLDDILTSLGEELDSIMVSHFKLKHYYRMLLMTMS